MRKMLSFVIVLAIFLTVVTIGANAEVRITLRDIQSVYIGETVTISGTTAFPEINIKVLSPDNTIYDVETVMCSNGEFSYIMGISDNALCGIYKVIAGVGDDVAVGEFEVRQKSSDKSNDATLSSIKVNGVEITGFLPETKNYTVTVPYYTSVVPVVSATATDSNATVEITQAAAIAPYGTTPGSEHKAIILVTAEDGVTKNTYTVTFIKERTPDEQTDPGVTEPGETETEEPGSKDPGQTDEQGDDQEDVEPKDTTDKEAAEEIVKLIEGLEDTISDIYNTLNKINELIEEIDNAEIASDIAESIIIGTARTTVGSDLKYKGKKEIERKLIKILENVIAKKSEHKIEANVVDSEASAKIGEEQVNAILSSMDEVIKLVEEQNKKLEEHGIESKIEKKITLTIETDVDVSSIITNIPTEIFNAAKEKGIEKIEIKTDVASIVIPVNFTEQILQASNIIVEVKKIGLSDNEKSKLSDSQRELLENQETIYDLNIAADGQQVHGFNNKVSVRIAYTLKEGENKDYITVFYMSEDGTIENIAGKYDEETSEIVFSTDHFSKYVIKNISIKFKDIQESFWARQYIESMASKGIISGKPGGIYDPNSLVTRAEFAKMIVMAAGLVEEDAKCSFVDVSEKQWYYKYVSSAVKAGIIAGRPDNIFAPNDNITREEMAVMIYRALGERPPKNINEFLEFKDKQEISDWAKEAVASVVRSEIMNGKPGNIMDPKGYSTRAEAAAVIYRYFNN
ncbi:MAG TPA: hypothetical protein GXX37_13745 [Clostridiaceae bacterium]|nr:hypothetical protein [Clostridiaceae bacterium]